MRLPSRLCTVSAALLALPSLAYAGMVFRSAPVFQAAPVFRSVPTFRAPIVAPTYRMGPVYRSPVFRSGPVISREAAFERSRTFNPSNPWVGMPPQVRNHSYGTPEQILRTPGTVVTSRAEADLLNKLHVSPPPGSGMPERAAVASQAENQLLNQLHASPPSAVVTIIPGQQKAAAAQSAENTLLRELQAPAPSPAQTSAPISNQNTTIVTIIPGKEQGSANLPTISTPSAPGAGQSSQIITIVPGVKQDTTVAGPLTIIPSTGRNYTFTATRSGNVQIAENEKTIATTTPQIAAQQYGYHLPNPSIQGVQPTPATAGVSVVDGRPVTIGTPTPLPTGPGVVTQTNKDGLNASFNASAAQAGAQFGNVKASVSFGNINGSFGIAAGPLPLSATAGVNGSASLIQGQISDRPAGVTITGDALSVQGSASMSVSPVGASVTATAGAYLVEGEVDKQITVGRYDVNLGMDAGVGAQIGGTQSVGISGVAGDYSFGPGGIFYSVTPN
jgi:hypothetical protein